MTSFPERWKPWLWSMRDTLSTVREVKGVPSPVTPESVPTLERRASIKWPMVMREGMACGLTIMSGVMPSCVKGMSSWR